MLKKLLIILGMILVLTSRSTTIMAQSKFASEQHFQELFVTAGYSTAFGAALGAAALGLTHEPSQNLQFIVTGASIGFIMGSIVGTYVIFTPVFTYGPTTNMMGHLPFLKPDQPIALRPSWDLKTHQVESVDMSLLLASF